MAERTKATVLKTVSGATRSWVRIPLLPPLLFGGRVAGGLVNRPMPSRSVDLTAAGCGPGQKGGRDDADTRAAAGRNLSWRRGRRFRCSRPSSARLGRRPSRAHHHPAARRWRLSGLSATQLFQPQRPQLVVRHLHQRPVDHEHRCRRLWILPAGGTYDTSYAPIAPGSSSGIYSLADARVHVATPSPLLQSTQPRCGRAMARRRSRSRSPSTSVYPVRLLTASNGQNGCSNFRVLMDS